MRFVCFAVLFLQPLLLFSIDAVPADNIINRKSDINLFMYQYTSDIGQAGLDYQAAAELFRAGQFKRVGSRNYYGEQNNGIWFAVPVSSEKDLGRCFFVFDFHYIEYIEFFLFKDNIVIESQLSGTHITSSREPMEFINPVFPVEIDKGEYLILFQVRSEEAFVPVMLLDERNFVSYSTRRMASLSLLYGVLICFVLVNFYFCLFNRETSRIAVYFILFMLFELMYQASRDGFLNTLLWPDNFFMIDRFYLAMLAISSFMSIPLMNSFLKLEKHSRKVQRIVWIIALSSLVYAPLFFLVPKQHLHWVIFIGRYHEIALILLQLILPAVFFRKVDTAGKVFSIGWMAAMLFYDIATLKAKGVLPYENFTIMILYGSLTVSVSNLIALGIMLKTTAEEKKQAESKLKAAGFQLMQNRSRPHFLMNTL